LRIGDLSPERVPVEFSNGRMLQAWVCTNRRYPASVAADLEDARNTYLATRERVYEGPPPPALVAAARALLDVLPPQDDLYNPISAAIEQQRIELAAAIKAYDDTPQFRPKASEWETYLTRCLLLLIPGLEYSEADMMSQEQRLGWLFDLGYFQRNEATDMEGNEPSSPEPAVTEQAQETPETSIGDKPAQNLAGSTT
jgi:hypothetical protein